MKAEGSFSVEAALVMPFVLFIIVLMIRMGLFFCDCCMAEAVLYERVTGSEVTAEKFFVSDCQISEVQSDYSKLRVDAVLKMKSNLFTLERKFSICILENEPVKNAHLARAVRKIIKNLYIIMGD